MNQKPHAIDWPECMRIGIDSIDEQHQMLAIMVQMAESRLSENNSRAEIEIIIRDLMSYALYHFDTEEELMLIHDYCPTERKQHCQEHRNFSTTVAQFQQDIHLGKLVSREELLGFVREWLAIHIMNTDLKLGEFLCKLEKGDS